MTSGTTSLNRKRAANASTVGHAGSVNAACEQLLLPICQHFLDRGMGVSQFLHLAKVSFVNAAVAAIKHSGERPTVSRVAAITGLQRKEIRLLTEPTEITTPL